MFQQAIALVVLFVFRKVLNQHRLAIRLIGLFCIGAKQIFLSISVKELNGFNLEEQVFGAF